MKSTRRLFWFAGALLIAGCGPNGASETSTTTSDSTTSDTTTSDTTTSDTTTSDTTTSDTTTSDEPEVCKGALVTVPVGATVIATAMAAAPDGTILVGGVFQGTLDIGVGSTLSAPTGLFLARFDVTGKPLSLQQVGQGATGDTTWSFSGLAVGSDGTVYFAAHASSMVFGSPGGSTSFAGAIAPGGSLVWAQSLDDLPWPVESWAAPERRHPGSVAVGPQGDVWVVAYLDPIYLAEQATEDWLLARFDPSGQLVWSAPSPEPHVGALGDLFVSVAGVTPGGDVAVLSEVTYYDPGSIDGVGYTSNLQRVDATGDLAGSNDVTWPVLRWLGHDARLAPDGTVFVAGRAVSQEHLGAFVAAIDAQNNGAWVKFFEDDPKASWPTRASSLDVEPGGDLAVVGRFMGVFDAGVGPITGEQDSGVFAVRLDPAGHVLCARTENSSDLYFGTSQRLASSTSGGSLVLLQPTQPDSALHFLSLP